MGGEVKRVLDRGDFGKRDEARSIRGRARSALTGCSWWVLKEGDAMAESVRALGTAVRQAPGRTALAVTLTS